MNYDAIPCRGKLRCSKGNSHIISAMECGLLRLLLYATFEICVLAGNALDLNMTKLHINSKDFCIDFPTLNQMKNLLEIIMYESSMSYFPVKNCNSPTQEEDDRPVDLPNLKKIRLVGEKLKKAPNLNKMPRLESFEIQNTLITDMPGTPFQNNSLLSEVQFFYNKQLQAPNLTGGCEQLDLLRLFGNNLASLPKEIFVGCKIKEIYIMEEFFMDWPNFQPLGASVETIVVGTRPFTEWINDGSFKGLKNLKKLYLESMRHELILFFKIKISFLHEFAVNSISLN